MSDEAVANAWKAREAEQRQAWLALSYTERLHWLEDAKRFCALALGAARRKRRADKLSELVLMRLR